MIVSFTALMTLYPSSRSSNCILSIYVVILIYLQKKRKRVTRVKTWVKISKVMPQPKSISPGKGREALRQKVQIFWLKYDRA